MKQIKIIIGDKTISLTANQFSELVYCTKSMIDWDMDGCYGDGDKIYDKKAMNTAIKALQKISKELN